MYFAAVLLTLSVVALAYTIHAINSAKGPAKKWIYHKPNRKPDYYTCSHNDEEDPPQLAKIGYVDNRGKTKVVYSELTHKIQDQDGIHRFWNVWVESQVTHEVRKT